MQKIKGIWKAKKVCFCLLAKPFLVESEAPEKPTSNRVSSPLYQIVQFIEALTTPSDDARVIVNKEDLTNGKSAR